LRNPNRKWKPAAFSQFGRGENIIGYSVRSGKWRYTEWYKKSNNKLILKELYDHSHGPLAKANLAKSARSRKTVNELSKILDKGQGWKKILNRMN
jgi:iduronate 2-sulfatase